MSKPIITRVRRLDRTIAAVIASALGAQSIRRITSAAQWIRTTVAGAQTFNLPAATGKGGMYRFFIGVTATGNKIIKASGTDTMQGSAAMAGGTPNTFASASNTNTITLNGSTSGGVLGTQVELWDIAPGTWAVQVSSVGTGIQVTPFSNT